MILQDQYKTRSLLYKGTIRLIVVITVPIPDVIFVVAHPPIVVLLDQPTDEDVGYSFHSLISNSALNLCSMIDRAKPMGRLP